jgi:hypothetical protein
MLATELRSNLENVANGAVNFLRDCKENLRFVFDQFADAISLALNIHRASSLRITK